MVSLTGLRTRVDHLSDEMATGALRRRADAWRRKLGLTRTGYIAVGGVVLLWVMGLVVAGPPMYMAAYGSLLFIVIAIVLAPRRIGLTGERFGLFPRAQEGDRLDVEVKLHANRAVTTFVL